MSLGMGAGLKRGPGAMGGRRRFGGSAWDGGQQQQQQQQMRQIEAGASQDGSGQPFKRSK